MSSQHGSAVGDWIEVFVAVIILYLVTRFLGLPDVVAGAGAAIAHTIQLAAIALIVFLLLDQIRN